MKFNKIKRIIVTSIMVCSVVGLFPMKAFAGSCGNEDTYFPRVENALNSYPSTDFSRSAFETYMRQKANEICSGDYFRITNIEISNIDESQRNTTITYKITARCHNHGTRTLQRTFSVTLPETVPAAPVINISRSGNNAVVNVVPNISNFKSVKIYKGNSLIRDNASTTYTEPINVTPNKPVLKESATLADKCRFKVFTANSNSVLTYKAQVVSHYGSYTSPLTTKTFDVSSVVRGYAIKVDRNSNTDPGNNINSADGSIDVTGYKRGDVVYVHAKAINTFNIASPVYHYRYVVGQTAQDLKNDINNYVSRLNDSNSSISSINSSDIQNLRTNANIPFQYVEATDTKATKYNNGSIVVKSKVNNTDYNATRVITARPEYQTKDEFKSDIDNYIDAGNVQRDWEYVDFVVAKKKIKRELEANCKDNPNLGEIEIDINNNSTEFTSKDISVEVYYKD